MHKQLYISLLFLHASSLSSQSYSYNRNSSQEVKEGHTYVSEKPNRAHDLLHWLPRLIQEKVNETTWNHKLALEGVQPKQGGTVIWGGSGGNGPGGGTALTATAALGFAGTAAVLFVKAIPFIILAVKLFFTPGILLTFVLSVAPILTFFGCILTDCYRVLGFGNALRPAAGRDEIDLLNNRNVMDYVQEFLSAFQDAYEAETRNLKTYFEDDEIKSMNQTTTNPIE